MEFGGYKGTGPRVRVRRRAELGRRLTRRLSLVAKMPAAILSRANPPEPRPVEITAIAPDKTQLTVSKSFFTVFKPLNYGGSVREQLTMYKSWIVCHRLCVCVYE
ncbi:hypothetical protein WN55_00858 [Dufourea novaeangliae]|uniref:Uncharacterized protein n=1 Tax=Dufourea novaeangliae TaxID=178035 RepID=A0A154PD18_DUFNO|nr:hypothetical protein WN55_00858 [Dufourea novaeangliae]